MTKQRGPTRSPAWGTSKSGQEHGLRVNYPHLRYEPHTFEYTIPTRYTPDFYLGLHADGKPIYIECKEWLPYEDVTKYKHFCEQYPQIHLAFLVKSIQPRTLQRLAVFAWDVEVSSLNVLPPRWYQYYASQHS